MAQAACRSCGILTYSNVGRPPEFCTACRPAYLERRKAQSREIMRNKRGTTLQPCRVCAGPTAHGNARYCSLSCLKSDNPASQDRAQASALKAELEALGLRRCSACTKLKDIYEDFYWRPERPYSRCKPCHNEDTTKWAKKNKARKKQLQANANARWSKRNPSPRGSFRCVKFPRRDEIPVLRSWGFTQYEVAFLLQCSVGTVKKYEGAA